MTVDLSRLIAAADTVVLDGSAAKSVRVLAGEIAVLARSQQPPVPVPTPTHKILKGAWVTEPHTAGAPTDMNQIAKRFGPSADLIHFSTDGKRIAYPGLWANVKAYNPKAKVLLDLDMWGLSMSAIASGSADATLKTLATTIAATGVETILRVGHEMNGKKYPWALETPATYVAGFIRAANIVRPLGLKMCWCPNVWWAGSNAADPTPWKVPADSVDWVMLDGYDWGMSFDRVFKSSVDTLRAWYPGKKLGIGEFNVQNGLTFATQKAWLDDAFAKAIAWKLDAMCLFIRADDDGTWKWADDAAKGAFLTALRFPEYQP